MIEQSVALNYMRELRLRLLRCVAVLGALFVVLSFFSNTLYHWLAVPLLQQMPHHEQLIATSVASPFVVPLKLSFVVSFSAVMPFLLYQLWGFVTPALYKEEKKLAWFLLFSSSALFYLGIAFAYFIVFPLVFHFLLHTAPLGVEVRPDINEYLSFTLKLLLSFGVVFEIPVAILLLVKSKIVTVSKLKEWRPYFIVLAFIVGMFLTPPDVFSQILLAVPICLLFEAGLLLARFL